MAQEVLRSIEERHAIEADIRGRQPEERRYARDERSRTLLESPKQWLEETFVRAVEKIGHGASSSLRAGTLGGRCARGVALWATGVRHQSYAIGRSIATEIDERLTMHIDQAASAPLALQVMMFTPSTCQWSSDWGKLGCSPRVSTIWSMAGAPEFRGTTIFCKV